MINLHIKDINILYKIQSFFGVGSVTTRKNKNICVYRVTKIDELIDVIVNHFSKYPLLTIRKQCQLEFAKNCSLHKDFDNFLYNKKNMYINKNKTLDILNKKTEFNLPFYFKP